MYMSRCRFAHELQSAQSTNQERCDSLSSALECVRGASVRIASVEGKLERERVVLEEKVEVSVGMPPGGNARSCSFKP